MTDCTFDIGDLRPVTNMVISDGDCTVNGFYTGVVNCNIMNTNNIIINNPTISNTVSKKQLEQQTQYISGTYGPAKNSQPILSVNSGIKATSNFTLRNIVGGSGNFQFISTVWAPKLGIFCILRNDTASGRLAYISPDGINWTTSGNATIFAGNWRALCWSPELSLFCAADESTTHNGKVVISPDGVNWTFVSTGYVRIWRSICWSPQLGIFCVVGSGDTTRPAGVMISKNGTDWTLIEVPEKKFWINILWCPELGIFVVASASADGLLISNNGIDWKSITLSAYPDRSLCWSPHLGIFCSISSAKISISKDGINWKIFPSPLVGTIYYISWCPEIRLFCAVGARCAVSPDGINWTLQPTFTSAPYQSAWAPELGIVCSGSFGAPAPKGAYTSSLTGRPPTSFNTFDFTYNNINQNGTWTIQRILRSVLVSSVTAENLDVTGQQYMQFNNTSTQTINSFTGGVVGQRLTLSFGTTAVTINGGTNIKLSSASFTSTANDTISLVCVQTSPLLWLETRRSINADT